MLSKSLTVMLVWADSSVVIVMFFFRSLPPCIVDTITSRLVDLLDTSILVDLLDMPCLSDTSHFDTSRLAKHDQHVLHT